MAHPTLHGIVPPIITPMNADESINIPELRRQIERQIAGGVHGIFCFGTNGEGYILSMKEKEEILEATIDQVAGRVPVYAGTGCIITPSFALASQEELYRHYVEVAKHVNIPIVLYNIPPRTGNKLLPETVARLARDVDVICGAKDSSGDIENLKAFIRVGQELGRPFSVFAGNDGAILTGLRAGGAGGIAGRANLYPKTVAAIYDSFVAGDIARAEECQQRISTLQRVFKFGNPNTIIKKAVNLLGYPVGECRRPFNYLCDEGVAELKAVLKENEELGLC